MMNHHKGFKKKPPHAALHLLKQYTFVVIFVIKHNLYTNNIVVYTQYKYAYMYSCVCLYNFRVLNKDLNYSLLRPILPALSTSHIQSFICSCLHKYMLLYVCEYRTFQCIIQLKYQHVLFWRTWPGMTRVTIVLWT